MNDYIDREAALRPFIVDKNGRRIPEVDGDNFPVTIEIKEVKRILRAVPSADVKPELPPMFDDDDIETIRIIIHAYIENLCNAGRYKAAMEVEKSLDKFTYLAKVADVKPVVLCENCARRFRPMKNFCNVWGRFTKDTDYCSYGELRGNVNE